MHAIHPAMIQCPLCIPAVFQCTPFKPSSSIVIHLSLTSSFFHLALCLPWRFLTITLLVTCMWYVQLQLVKVLFLECSPLYVAGHGDVRIVASEWHPKTIQTLNEMSSTGKNYGLAHHTLVRGLFMREELASSSALALRSSWLTVDMGWLTIALRKIFFTKKIGSENKFNFMIILTLSVFLISIKSQFSIFQCVIKLYSLAFTVIGCCSVQQTIRL